jgi:hypothetical protein
MHLRRTLSKRLSRSFGLGIRFSKSISLQSELFVSQESSEDEPLENHKQSIVTKHYEPLENHEFQHQSIISYRPRRVVPERDIATSEERTKKESVQAKKKRVETEYISRSSTEMRGRIERESSSRLSNGTEGDSEGELEGFIEREYISPRNETVETSEQEALDLIETEISRWSQSTSTAYSTPSSTRFLQTSYEERVAEWIDFYSTSPLMRCLDTASERQYYEGLLFESLLSDVKEPIPATRRSRNYRGVVQIREFWENVRKELSFSSCADEQEVRWRDGYPRSVGDPHCPANEDTLDEYVGFRRGSIFCPGPPSP